MSDDHPSSIKIQPGAIPLGSDAQSEVRFEPIPWWVYAVFFALSIGIFIPVLNGGPEQMRAGLTLAFTTLGATILGALVMRFSQSGTLRVVTYVGYAIWLIIVSITLSILY